MVGSLLDQSMRVSRDDQVFVGQDHADHDATRTV
jgi:hypothetical protein